MYDSIIIGTGPAGLSAALNLKTYKKGFYLVWFEEPKRKGAKGRENHKLSRISTDKRTGAV